MFSSRLPARLRPNAFSEAVARARASGAPLHDLTETNPTAVGLAYPDLAALLCRPDVASYRPLPLGDPAARAAVALHYEQAGTPVPPAHIVLTASTSEAYAFLFKLLCNPGDHVLVPQPSYPLFDLLTRLDAVVPVPYRLDPRGLWCLDRGGLEAALTPRTRAILVVSPNNPTGSMIDAADRDWIVTLARRHDLAIVADEVFAEYPIEPRPDATRLAGEGRVLTFALGGLSKTAGLPQMKLAWIVVSGPEADVAAAMARLEIIADTYLSVSTPVQMAAAGLLEAGDRIRAVIGARIRENLAVLRAAVARHASLDLLVPEGGWSAVVRAPALLPEDQMVRRLVAEEGVIVHPGYFFDFASEAYLVISLLPSPGTFAAGVALMTTRVSGEWH
jgi:aspartate/methionine/tyrosine aminotransferase